MPEPEIKYVGTSVYEEDGNVSISFSFSEYREGPNLYSRTVEIDYYELEDSIEEVEHLLMSIKKIPRKEKMFYNYISMSDGHSIDVSVDLSNVGKFADDMSYFIDTAGKEDEEDW